MKLAEQECAAVADKVFDVLIVVFEQTSFDQTMKPRRLKLKLSAVVLTEPGDDRHSVECYFKIDVAHHCVAVAVGLQYSLSEDAYIISRPNVLYRADVPLKPVTCLNRSQARVF